MAYLGFQKEGAKFSLATSAHTKGGQTKFSIFLVCQNKNFGHSNRKNRLRISVTRDGRHMAPPPPQIRIWQAL